ncbi:UNVERIFIED_ORG: ribosomal protein L40E [Paraburkholderia sediminicola]|uniref:double zinc ribbon domain-containing protein n=1 Tax=Paraburkholderia aspalathi TaxID=1324617 RepID=UPI002AF16435|nr:ribosomal protein L40E [Paraburkholderia sediminicola]
MGFWEKMLSGHRGGGHHGGGYRSGGHGDWGRGDGYDSRDDGNGGRPPPTSTLTTGVTCSGCRAVNTTSARFCQQCGASLASAACKECQALLPAGARFCQQCGAAAQR